jgi:hypothetical protein
MSQPFCEKRAGVAAEVGAAELLTWFDKFQIGEIDGDSMRGKDLQP